MAWKQLAEEAAPLLSDPESRAYLEARLEELRGQIKDGQQLRGRLMLLLLLIAGFFELVVRRAVVEFDLGIIRISDLSLVMKLLPVVFSFVFAYVMSSVSTTGMMRALHSEILRKAQPAVAGSSVKELLLPQSVFSIINVIDAFQTGKMKVTPLAFFVTMIFASVMVLPSVVVVYMFWRCFGAFGAGDWMVWVSCVLSALMVMAGFEILIIYTDVDPRETFNL